MLIALYCLSFLVVIGTYYGGYYAGKRAAKKTQKLRKKGDENGRL